VRIDELIKDKEDTAAWRNQKRKLIRFLVGAVIVLVSLGVAVILFLNPAKKEQVAAATADQDADVRAVAELMELQQETKALHREVKLLRKQKVSRRRTVASVQPKTRKVFLADSSSTQIILNDSSQGGFSETSFTDSDAYVPTGAVFQAQLITPIKTSVQRSFTMAETTNEFRMDTVRKIPKGSRLIGRSRLNPVLKGVIVEFDTLVLPNGKETRISSLALSRNALPEIDGLFFSNKLETYGTALAFGFLSGFAGAAQQRTGSAFGSVPEVSLENQVLAGLSTASFQVAEDILRDIRNSAVEYVVVPAGEAIFVALTRRYEISQGESDE